MASNEPSANSWLAIECLLVLAVLGLASFFWEPKYPVGLMMIITALVSTLSNALGVKSGSKMPEQIGDAKIAADLEAKK